MASNRVDMNIRVLDLPELKVLVESMNRRHRRARHLLRMARRSLLEGGSLNRRDTAILIGNALDEWKEDEA